MTKASFGIRLIAIPVVLCGTLFIAMSAFQERTDPAIKKLAALDVPLSAPNPGDWLAAHAEKGQTFQQYISSGPVRTTSVRNKIYILPIGEFSGVENKIIQSTAAYLTVFFDRKTVVLPAVPDSLIPPSGRRRHQLHTGTILDILEKRFPKDAAVMMALTSKDLYPSPSWNFVFGQARPAARVAVSSFFRYAPKSMDEKNYHYCLERIIKTSSHEIGHMFSCLHCTHAVCLMNGSNSLAEADTRPNRLCSVCLSKFHWNLGFSVEDRLAKLNAYFRKHGLERDLILSDHDMKALR